MQADSGLPVYKGMTRTELSVAYNNAAAVADSQEWLARWRAKSAEIRARPDTRLDLRYDPAPRACLDYFPCGAANAPLFVFIHGGYWQRNDKDMFAFVAEGPLASGFDVATVGYTLAPEASLSRIVEEMRGAVAYLSDHAGEFGFEADKLILGGWSAGGHLTAALMNHRAVSAILPISGIFDLEPIALTDLNDALQLSPNEVEQLSPIRALQARPVPICVAYGDQELPELQRQSIEFIEAGSAQGLQVEALPLSGHHHFSILDEFSAPDGRLLEALRRLAA